MSPEIEARILAAARQVYAQYGFRGATTRRIAAEAGVNEVTLFRIFGSKAQLLQAMLVSQVSVASAPAIDITAPDPHRELARWCGALLAYLRSHGQVIRQTIAEAEERPDAACAACQGPGEAAIALASFVEHLRSQGRLDAGADIATAISMFMSAMFGDALYRDIMPQNFPQPAAEAPSLYVNTFLRALGMPVPRSQRRRVPAVTRGRAIVARATGTTGLARASGPGRKRRTDER